LPAPSARPSPGIREPRYPAAGTPVPPQASRYCQNCQKPVMKSPFSGMRRTLAILGRIISGSVSGAFDIDCAPSTSGRSGDCGNGQRGYRRPRGRRCRRRTLARKPYPLLMRRCPLLGFVRVPRPVGPSVRRVRREMEAGNSHSCLPLAIFKALIRSVLSVELRVTAIQTSASRLSALNPHVVGQKDSVNGGRQCSICGALGLSCSIAVGSGRHSASLLERVS
jgi:hypothetical protein